MLIPADGTREIIALEVPRLALERGDILKFTGRNRQFYSTLYIKCSYHVLFLTRNHDTLIWEGITSSVVYGLGHSFFCVSTRHLSTSEPRA